MQRTRRSVKDRGGHWLALGSTELADVDFAWEREFFGNV